MKTKRKPKAIYVLFAHGNRGIFVANSLGHAVHLFRRKTGVQLKSDGRGGWSDLHWEVI